MIEWIAAIAEYARVTRGVTDFMVLPQNAADIIRNEDYELDDLSEMYFDTIDGIGVEDLFYDELTAADDGDVEYRLDQLSEFADRGKTILVTDYVLPSGFTPAVADARVARFYERALAYDFIPYAAMQDRDLNEIVLLASEGWSISQPPEVCLEFENQPARSPAKKAGPPRVKPRSGPCFVRCQ